MPKRNTIFADKAFYHIFNRGVEKRTIFVSDQDYQTFLDILTYYLKFIKKSPLNALGRIGLTSTGIFQNKIKLISYCLMPNHFHLLLFQEEKDAISKFMQRISTTFARYFNKRYKRVGPLFQNRFRAKHIETEPYLLQTTKYIHRNPTNTEPGYVTYPWSSYQKYLDPLIDASQIQKVTYPNPILDFFSNSNPQLTYQGFVEETGIANWFQDELKWLA